VDFHLHPTMYKAVAVLILVLVRFGQLSIAAMLILISILHDTKFLNMLWTSCHFLSILVFV